MDNIVGTVSTASIVIGLGLFYLSLAMTMKANRTSAIPYVENPPHTPAGSLALRATGAGLTAFGATALAATTSQWSAVIVLLTLVLPTCALITLHNYTVTPPPPDAPTRTGTDTDPV